MWKKAVLLILLVFHPCGSGLLQFMLRNIFGSVPKEGDARQPLVLTPYIEAGNVTEERRLSTVAPFQGLNLVSYCGFLTVNKTYNRNLSGSSRLRMAQGDNCSEGRLPAGSTPSTVGAIPLESAECLKGVIQSSTAPVVLWLQGGPGVSSLMGLFVEHGPYVVTENLTVAIRDFAWTSTLSMLYIGNPVGTGFSFTDDPQGYATNQEDVAQDLFSALIQFFQLFPEFQENDFYVTGQSYAGKFVTAIAHYIHTLNPRLLLQINLKGLAIGNGFCDPEMFVRDYGTFLYQVGLLDEKQRKYFQEQIDKDLAHIKEGEWLQAFEVLERLMDDDHSYLVNVTGCPDLSNIVYCMVAGVCGHLEEDDSTALWDGPLRALPASDKLTKVLMYGGQMDNLTPVSLIENYLITINWKGSQEYREAERKIWKIFKSDQEVASYVQQVGNFHQVIVQGAGHILPFDQPLRAFEMIDRFIYEKGWDPYLWMSYFLQRECQGCEFLKRKFSKWKMSYK